MKNQVKYKCKYCGEEFEDYLSNHRKFCNQDCYHKSTKGKPSWNKGKKCLWVALRKGNKHPNWKGGRLKQRGYIYIFKPEHPYCDTRGYVPEHRLVMEKHLGRYLKPEEVVHHKNGIKCNNRIENLHLFKNAVLHKKNHYPKGSLFGINLGIKR